METQSFKAKKQAEIQKKKKKQHLFGLCNEGVPKVFALLVCRCLQINMVLAIAAKIWYPVLKKEGKKKARKCLIFVIKNC